MTAPMDNNGDQISVGGWLRGAREDRGESLDDVARVTRIGKGYLEAIELGELHKLPSEAYARGFVRLYAHHLGLSGDEAVARLQGRGGSSAVIRGAVAADTPGGEHAAIRAASGIPRRWAIPVALLIFLLLFATFSRMRNDDSGTVPPVPLTPSQPAPSTPQPPATVVAPAGEATQSAPPAAAGPGTMPAEPAQPEGIILRLKAVQAGKLHITIDGSVSQEYDLNVGDLVEWKAEKMFLLELDNAGSVEGDLNGRPLQPLGEPGRAAHLIIGADGVRQQ